jgi:tetratricopeptide (TPR) repeat protein/predicted Ser/Thr protein kinase
MSPETSCPRCGGPLDADGAACPWCPTLPTTRASTPAPAAPPATWTRIGKYFLAERIGQGGMGEVWKALDSGLGRPVALKFLKAGDDTELARFRREAQTAASLNHPNIASIYEVGDAEGRPFIAMQFVDGQTLGRLPKADRRLLMKLVLDAARAVDYAHAQGIIHRDLKPDNIMASPRSSGWHVTVLDFGLARPIEGGQTVSQTGLVLGTPAYMSPEQTRGDKLDPRTDVYSLGATLYELLAGRPPFYGANAYEVARKVLSEEPVPLRTINSRIHQDVETIVLKCLEKDPERRYATAADLAGDLERCLAGEPIQARPVGTLHRWIRYCAKRRGAFAATLLAAVLLVAGVVVARERAQLAAGQAAIRAGRDAWEDVLKASTPNGQERARALAATALGHFDRAARVHETAEAHVLRGRCLQVLGRAGDASGAWERALQLDPANVEARYQAAKLRLVAYQRARGTPLIQPYASGSEADGPPQLVEDPAPETAVQERLRAEAETLLTGGPVGAPERSGFLRGLLALGQARFAEAAEGVAQYTRLEPWDAAAIRLEAIAWFYAGAYDRAGEALDRALAQGPDADAYLWRGLVHLRRRQYEAAFADSTRALQLDPSLVWAYRNRARAYRYRGEVDAALADLDKALELDPSAWLTCVERAYLRHVYRGDLDGALADAGRAVALQPASAFAHQSRASIRATAGDPAGAAADARRALELDPRRDDVLLILVAALLATGDAEGARRAADQAVASTPSADAFRSRAAVREAAGDVVGALEDLGRAIEKEPGSHRALQDRARLRREAGDRDGAAADFARALEEVDRQFDRRPRDPRGHVRRGQIRETMGERAAAIEDYTRAVELDPKHGPAYAARAQLRLAAGQFDGALEDVRRALRPLPLLAGTARLGRGDAAGALLELARAGAAARTERGLAYGAVGDWAKARAELEAAAGEERRAWKERDRLRLLAWAAAARGGDRAGADAALDAWFKARADASLRGWYRRAADVVTGRLPEGDLAAVLGSHPEAERGERACEAEYYVGLRRLLGGDAAGAKASFEKALKAAPRRDLPEALAAAVELRALEARK